METATGSVSLFSGSCIAMASPGAGVGRCCSEVLEPTYPQQASSWRNTINSGFLMRLFLSLSSKTSCPSIQSFVKYLCSGMSLPRFQVQVFYCQNCAGQSLRTLPPLS
ncbi:hypothetical protein KIL84_002869 [Mauremys mutica]|uniref:Uncharacterized protein n=1 Tax=Mauremys mutica TaxID=74926 RepID=A0A9D4ASX7_9SAUR|nr:hypothetical protein KIL84_002869 [Mauremys mutica]